MTVDDLVAAVMPAYAPPPDLSVSEWAEAYRRLPESSPSGGSRWSNKTAPYLTSIMDATCDPTVKTLVLMGAHQTGKSEVIHNALAYWISHDPSTILMVMPSFEDARRRSRGPLADLVRSTPSLRAVVRGRRAPRGSDEHGSTVLERVFPGGTLIVAGSGTANTFAGVSARRVVGDEFERFAILEEGDSASLLRNRSTAFYDGMLALVSTPLLVDGRIDAAFKATDQQRYHLRCAACGHEDWTTWQDANHFRVVYEESDPDTARLECPTCGARHDEVTRRRMVAAGRWLPTATAIDKSARGYHIPAMIATLGNVTLPTLVQKWLAARAGGPAALMTFINTTLAEPWEDRAGRVEPHALASRLEDYPPDVDVPAGAVCLTAGVDVQVDRFEVGVFGWGAGGEAWVVDAHNVPGDPTHPEVQAALLAALDERYHHASGARLAIITTCVDSGFLPDRVAYTLAARRPRRIFAVKGIGNRFGEPSILKYDPRHPPVTLNTDGLKLEVALGLELAAPGPGYIHLSRRCCDEDFLAQICAEHRETRRRNGVASLVWIEDRSANHALDCAVYARAAMKLLARISGTRTEDSLMAMMASRLKDAK